jgi:Metallo-beta-lactamase superfamily
MPFSEVTRIGPPAPDELEITVFGPSFGECIVVHFGSNRWFVVDSCLYPGIDGAVALSYLMALQLDVRSVVENILITHWHDDHCKGVSQLVEECPQAAVWIASTLTNIEFLRFVKRLSKNKALAAGTRTKEFSAVFDLLFRRRETGASNFGFASQRSVMHEAKGSQLNHGADFRLIALSPSHGDHLDFMTRLAELMPRARRQKGSLGSPSPNEISVAALMQVGEEAILLGADLENSKPGSGWDAVVSANRASPFGPKASVYKIPHHGSLTAHNVDIWSEMLGGDPIAVLTPWSRGRGRLPEQAGIRQLRP